MKRLFEHHPLVLLVAGALVITTAIEVPINNQVINWTEGNVPADWQEMPPLS